MSRQLVKGFILVLVTIVLYQAVSWYTREPTRKVFVLAVDGLDEKLLREYMSAGLLPNFQALAEQGDFKPLETTSPPLSPVAWSTFITGMGPGGHGIFDFVHRDPQTLMPYLSMSRVSPPERHFSIGSWRIPLSRGKVELLRKGRAFWQILEERGVPTTIFRMPANFPPVPSPGRSLSGMGTPDLLGTPGTFSFYTDDPALKEGPLGGGRIVRVAVQDGAVRSQLAGPKNTFRRMVDEAPDESGWVHPELAADFAVHRDPREPAAKLSVQGQEFLLKEGEWSDWIEITFRTIPYLVDTRAIIRFYLQRTHPRFRLYASPLQIDPAAPEMPISTPGSWSRELATQLGGFYTQELPEETKALSEGLFSEEEFWNQSQLVLGEQQRALNHLLTQFKEGLLFFYLSSVDQVSHMLWSLMDPSHPGYRSGSDLRDGIRRVYQQVDSILGRALRTLDQDTTVVVMSDHGFAPFYREVNLNSWLLQKGYARLKDPSKQGSSPLFMNVDWSRTLAYALGLNGVYVNRAGREREGIVESDNDYQSLLDELEADLLGMTDPRDGRQPVSLVTVKGRDFQTEHPESPDIIVGYSRGYRSSWTSPLGEFPRQIFLDNESTWSGDHSIDYRLVPGVLLTNRQISLEHPALYDLTVALLDEYGIEKHSQMIGQDCLSD